MKKALAIAIARKTSPLHAILDFMYGTRERASITNMFAVSALFYSAALEIAAKMPQVCMN